MDATIEKTVISTLEAATPALLATASPAAASAAALAPIALQFLQSAMQVQNAGLMTPDQLAAEFATIGQQVAATHAQWALLNAPKA